MLGQVRLRKNETLWRMVEKVYGIVDTKLLGIVLKANPRIKNPDRIAEGELISIPAFPASVKPLSVDVWWVQVGDVHSLEEAFHFLRSYEI